MIYNILNTSETYSRFWSKVLVGWEQRITVGNVFVSSSKRTIRFSLKLKQIGSFQSVRFEIWNECIRFSLFVLKIETNAFVLVRLF